MAKTKISEFSSTPANNTDIDSINIAEGCAPSNINDAIRELMAQLKDFQTGAVGDSFNGPIGSSTASTGAFTNITASGTLGVTGVATLGAGAILNTPASVTLTNATGLPISTGVSGLGTGVATALAVNVGSAGAPVVNGGALGTPSSGTVTNLTGTASININGTVGATTPTTGAFTTVAASSDVTLSGGTANGVTYLNGSKVLTSGSALTFNGTNLSVTGSLTSSNAGSENVFLSDGSVVSSLQNGANSLYFNVNTNSATSGNFIWRNTSSYSEQMRLTSTGLGIGTSSFSEKLRVEQTAVATVAQFRKSSVANVVIGYNGTSVNYNDVDTQYWRTAAASDLMALTSTGLGIGTSSLVSRLTVKASGGTYATGSLALVGSSSGTSYITNAGGTLYVSNDGSTDQLVLNSAGNLGLGVTPNVNDFTSGALGMHIKGSSNYGILKLESSDNKITWFATGSAATYLYVKDANPLIFGTNNTERARIDSSGNLLVGVTSGSSKLYIGSDTTSYSVTTTNANASPAGYRMYYGNATAPNNTGNLFLLCDDSSTTRASIRSNGGIANYSANNVNISDRREKTNFAPAKSYLDIICSIPVQTYNYIDQNLEEDDGLTLGVVAQDVQAVAPELVTESNWGTKEEPKMRLSIYQTDLQYALMKALQELKAEFDAYKASHP